MSVKPIPEGYHSITPYLIIRNASAAIDWYKKAFNAVELMRMDHNGVVGHAEMLLGDSHIMLAEENPMYFGPEKYGGSAVSLMFYLPDVDACFARATAAGATVLQPLKDHFYGDRSATLRDPFGHVWTISTHIEDIDPEEMARRAAAWKPEE
jgi:PhnB protein